MSVWNDLLGNLAILVISTSLWTFSHQHTWRMKPIDRALWFGAIMAIGTACAMALPFQLMTGVRLDLRYAFIGIAGFFGGPVAVIFPTAIAIFCRLISGGTGVWVGLPMILAAATVGICSHRLRSGQIPDSRAISAFGFAVAMSGTVGFWFAMPVATWPMITKDVVGPFSLLLFGAAFISAKVIAHEMRRQEATAENRMFRSVIEALPDCLNAKDIDGHFLVANPATAVLMGAEGSQDLIGRTDFDFYARDTATEFRELEETFLKDGVATMAEQRFENMHGRTSWLSTLKAPLRDEAGSVIGIITHNREITEQKKTEQELALAQRRLSDAMASMADGFAMFDEEGVQVFSNVQYLDMFPKTAEVRTNGTCLRAIIRAAIERGEEVAVIADFEDVVERTYGAISKPGDRQMRLADGRWINARTRSTDEGGFLIVYSDVTKDKEDNARLVALNQQLGSMALQDGLTGLSNRRAFDLELEASAERLGKGMASFALLLLDVDHFKKFNDTYGHPAGDECLKLIADCVRSNLRSYPGGLVARYGGEEIAVILPHASQQEAMAIGSLVVSAIRAMKIPHSGSAKASVTVSIGVAASRSPNLVSSELLMEADRGLYEAKASGRDCVRSVDQSFDPAASGFEGRVSGGSAR